MAKENKEKLNIKANLERIAPQSVDSAMQTFAETAVVEEPKKKRNSWLSNVLLVAIIAATIYIMLQIGNKMGGGIQSFDEVIANSDTVFILITIGVLFALFALESSKYATIISVIDNRPRWKESIKVMFLGKYYDNVTPFASGGQPWQISYLNKKGFSGGTSTAVVMIKYIANIFMWLTVSAVAMLSNKTSSAVLVNAAMSIVSNAPLLPGVGTTVTESVEYTLSVTTSNQVLIPLGSGKPLNARITK